MMASEPLRAVRQRFRSDRKATASEFQCPVLVGTPPHSLLGEQWEQTASQITRSTANVEPMIYRVEKNLTFSNAFAIGITVGRVIRNDIVFNDSSVSRFHAFLQIDRSSGQWTLTDAESKNSTHLGVTILEPNKAAILTDQCRIRFGDMEVQFYMPESFIALLDGRLAPSAK